MNNLFKTKNLLMFLSFLLFGAFVVMAVGSFAGFIPASGIMLGVLIPIQNLDHEEADCNMAGISTIVYVVKKSDIKTYPSLTSNKTLPEHTVNLINDFTLKSGAFWRTFYSTQEMGEFKSEVAGNRDGEYFDISGNFFYPNTTARALGLSNIFKNADVIIIMKEFSGVGQMRVFGTMDLPARINPNENSGKAFADQKGITFNFSAKSCSVPYIYNGIILTELGQINTPYSFDSGYATVDSADGVRFVYEIAETAAGNITGYNGFAAGSSIRIENPNTSYSVSVILSNGGTVNLTTDKWIELFFTEDNTPVVINSNL